jgi:hypothetical protein
MKEVSIWKTNIRVLDRKEFEHGYGYEMKLMDFGWHPSVRMWELYRVTFLAGWL